MAEILNSNITAGQQTNGYPVIAEDATNWIDTANQQADWLDKAGKLSNELRVYKDGDLTYGIYPGNFHAADGSIVTYAGSTGNAVSGATTTLIWLDNSGTLHTTVGSGFTYGVITLATIVAGSTITSITDNRVAFGIGGGISGWSGYSGLSGTSGFSGKSGFSGISGASGTSGFSGKSGYSGASGTSGFSGLGTSGFSGVSGFSGISGTSGFSGKSGFSGISGTSGFSGTSGSSGYSGQFPSNAIAFSYHANNYTLNSTNGLFATFSSVGSVFGHPETAVGFRTSPTDINGTDITTWLTAMGSNAVMFLSKKGDPTTYVQYNVTQSVNNVTFLTFTVAVVASHGSWTANDIGIISFSINGPQGSSGFSGKSGYSGTSGFSGKSGFSGISGASGTSGYSGASGTSGRSGYSGTSVSGFSGISGFSGSSGKSGYSGLSGFSGGGGVSGYSGTSGKSGWSGTSGWSGPSGGASGFSGKSGFSGYSGASGYSGRSGYSGSYPGGATGTFTTVDSKTVTVTSGIIVSIV